MSGLRLLCLSALLLIAALITVTAQAEPTTLPVVQALSPHQYVSGAGALDLLDAQAPEDVAALGDKLKVIGDLAPEHIVEVVSGAQGEIGECYRDALSRDPGLKGEVVLQWEILPRGTVRRVAIASDGVEDEALMMCVVSKVYALRFLEPESSITVGVNFPLRFGADG